MPSNDDRLTTALLRQVQFMPLSWSGQFIPQIGQRVRVTSPDRGYGRVVGFIAVNRELGVHVSLDQPSGEWNTDVVNQTRALVLGHQIAPEDSE